MDELTVRYLQDTHGVTALCSESSPYMAQHCDAVRLIVQYHCPLQESAASNYPSQCRCDLCRCQIRPCTADCSHLVLTQLTEILSVLQRDLKPQNLLLSDHTPQAVLKIADFGFARHLQQHQLADTLCGSPLYMAPEILQSHKYDAKADLWSVGTILYELVVGRPPFNGSNHVALLHNIERNEAKIPDQIARNLSAACVDLIYSLLKRDPVQRISFEEFFNHPFLAATTPLAAAVPGEALVSDTHAPGVFLCQPLPQCYIKAAHCCLQLVLPASMCLPVYLLLGVCAIRISRDKTAVAAQPFSVVNYVGVPPLEAYPRCKLKDGVCCSTEHSFPAAAFDKGRQHPQAACRYRGCLSLTPKIARSLS